MNSVSFIAAETNLPVCASADVSVFFCPLSLQPVTADGRPYRVLF